MMVAIVFIITLVPFKVAAVEAHQVGESVVLKVRRGEGGDERAVEEVTLTIKLEAAAEQK